MECHCEAVFAEAISCFMRYFTQKEIATPSKSKGGGSQRHQFFRSGLSLGVTK
jgi:hypothetical protein